MRLFLECKPDETLAVAAGVARRDIIHSPGKGRVSRELSRISGAVGLVDEDPGSPEPSLFASFVEKSDYCKYDLRLRLDKARENRLVVICPRLEPWLIKTARAVNVKMEEFKLSQNVQELDSMINQRLDNIMRLLQKLEEEKSPRLAHLKLILTFPNL